MKSTFEAAFEKTANLVSTVGTYIKSGYNKVVDYVY